jgi:hypothetical protein
MMLIPRTFSPFAVLRFLSYRSLSPVRSFTLKGSDPTPVSFCNFLFRLLAATEVFLQDFRSAALLHFKA